MKYLKYILFGFLFLFIFNIDALAYGLSCDYEIVNPNDSNQIISTINISYDGENSPVITYDQKVSVGLFLVPDTISLNNIKTSSGDLTCPNLYQGYRNYWGANQYRIAINEKDIPNVFEIKTLEYIASTSWIENSNKPTYEYEDLSCKYVNNTGVTVSFTIQRNKTTNELTVVNPAIENALLTPIFQFENFNSFSCSQYINVRTSGFLNGYTYNISPSTSATEWVYTGSSNTADENSAHAIYLAYRNSKAPRIIIQKSGSGFKAYSNTLEVTVNNMSDYQDEFATGKTDNYPTYLVETNSGFEFTENKPGTYKNIYIFNKHLFSNSGNNEQLEATCQVIFGNDFLEFLNNNVFRVIYIGVPIILILLTSFDFAKVVFIDDKEGIQKAGKRFGKRVIVAVLIYLVPTILIFISNLIGVESIDDCVKQLEHIVEEESS